METIQRRAREIMGENFFGIEEAIRHFPVNPSRQQLAAFAEIPFSEAMLEESKDTHVLTAVFPLSILKIRSKMTSKFFRLSWYNKESFAKDRGDVSWYLVCKTPVKNSTSKNWSEQQALIAKDDEVPVARVMVYTIIGLYLATGERLFKDIYVRTSSVSSNGYHVDGGSFDPYGLRIGYSRDDVRRAYLAISSAKARIRFS